jgi:hypothetical protein
LSDHREYLNFDTIELIEATPSTGKSKTSEDLCERDYVHLV